MDELARQRLIKIGDLSAQFEVYEVSIGRDLERLERLGLLKRVHRLIFDSGTTGLQVARNISGALLTSGNLTIITSSLPDIHEQASANLAKLHADEIFPGADGTTLFHGVTTAIEVDRAGGRVSGRDRRGLRIELNRNRALSMPIV